MSMPRPEFCPAPSALRGTDSSRLRWLAAALACLIFAANARAQTLVTSSWLGGSGTWSTDANWSPAGSPNNNANFIYNASIAAAGTYTVTLDTQVTISNFTLNNATATLNVTGGLSLAGGGTANLTAGTLSLNGGTLSGGTWSGAPGSIAVNTGTISGATMNANLIAMTNGFSSLTLTNGTTFTSGSTLTLAFGSVALGAGQTSLGNVAIALTDYVQVYGGVDNTTITIQPSGNSSPSILYTGNGTVNGAYIGDNNGYVPSGTNRSIINAGSIVASVSAGNFGLLYIAPSGNFTNNGTINAQANTTIDTSYVGGYFKNTGTITGAAGSTLNLFANTYICNSGVISSANYIFIATNTGNLINVSTGSITVTAPGSLAIEPEGDFINKGIVNITGGSSINPFGNFINTSTATVTFSGTGSLSIIPYGNISNAGILALGSGTVFIAAGGSFTNTGTISLAAGGSLQLGSSLSTSALGTISRATPTTGTVTLSSMLTLSANFDLAAIGTLNTGGTNSNGNSISAIIVSGIGGPFTLSSSNGAQLMTQNCTLSNVNVANNVLTSPIVNLTLQNGVTFASGTALTISGTLTGGTGQSSFGPVPITLNGGASLVLSNGGTFTINPTGTSTPSVAFNFVSGNNSATINCTGTLVNAGVIRNNINSTGLHITTSGDFRNTGTIDAAYGNIIIQAGGQCINTGIFDVNSNLQGSTVTQSGGVINGNYGSLYGGTTTIGTNGTLEPGSATAANRLFIQNLAFTDSTATAIFKLNGPASYDQVRGYYTLPQYSNSLTLNNATLRLVSNYSPSPSDVFYIFTNMEQTTGTFNGLPDHGLYTDPNGQFTAYITYDANYETNSLTGGNDIAIYDVTLTPRAHALKSLVKHGFQESSS